MDREHRDHAADHVFRRIANFEDTAAGDAQPWLGGGRGLALGIALWVATAGAGALAVLLFSASFPDVGGSPNRRAGPEAVGLPNLLMYVLGTGFVMVLAAASAFWRRQRLAAHFEGAERALHSADARERQAGMAGMMLNARKGRAEHHRVARALTAYLRRAPHDHPEEAGQRQLAFSMLADSTLSLVAKQKLDLSGAILTGIRGVGADLAGVSLRGADLTGARLARANLQDADLVDARIGGADLTDANVRGTILDRGR
jgi:hypothetical protein